MIRIKEDKEVDARLAAHNAESDIKFNQRVGEMKTNRIKNDDRVDAMLRERKIQTEQVVDELIHPRAKKKE